MNSYLKSITPDSFSGAVFAVEGIMRAVVLINGPSGCKFYHSATSDNQMIHQRTFDPLDNPDEYYFGQPRVPCTYLDSNDYVYGSIEKLEAALCFIAEHVPFDLLCIVNSPGAALIGDDLKGIADRVLPEAVCLTVESPGFSLDIAEGFDKALTALLDKLDLSPAKEKKANTINILGLSIYHKYYKGDMEELRRIFGLCGIKINCFFGAGCTLEEIKALPEAALNVVIHPEFAGGTAEYMQRKFGVKTLDCGGPPVGFSATENLVSEVCSLLNIKSDPFVSEAEKARASAYVHISRVNSMTGLPKGVAFAVEGYPCDAAAYAGFITRYFGMVLSGANVLGAGNIKQYEKFRECAEGLGMSSALDTDIFDAAADLVFAGGSTIAALRRQKKQFCGIEISLPSLGYIDVLPKTHLGLTGALLLTEQVLNGLLF